MRLPLHPWSEIGGPEREGHRTLAKWMKEGDKSRRYIMNTIYDDSGRACGSYSSGSVYNSSSSKVGSVDDSGRVYDALGNSKGRVNEYGKVWNDSGNEVGLVSVDGKKVMSQGGIITLGRHSEADTSYNPYEPYLIRDGHRAGAGLLLLLGAAEKARRWWR
ncbi:5-fold beta-flower protein [Streptomyces antimycoticus]|uniref:5-fold beta-flower protein n=1 Tax=Streptomyces antimycoticus TaxID=68175 RepID=UPI0037CE2C9F